MSKTPSRGLSQAGLVHVTATLRGPVERGEVPGLVAAVSRGDAVHADVLGVQDLQSGVPMRRDSLFRLASAAKPITAVAALMLVEDGKLQLDESVERWLPELADRRVLKSLDSPLDDTVPAHRPITLRDLLTLRWGLGAIMARPGTYPLQRAMEEAQVASGFAELPFSADEFMRRLGALPLAHQPGEKWMYHTGYEVLGVLVARVSGRGFGDFLRERLFTPLGMKDTAFSVPADKLDRLVTLYAPASDTGRLTVSEPGTDRWSRPPLFESGGGQGGGLVSTADDVLAFGRMLLNAGRHGAQQLLSPQSIQAMLTDQISPAQKAASPFFPGFWDASGWGFGGSVTTRPDGVSPTAGRYGWGGGTGTTFFIDPRQDLAVVLLTQRQMTGPDDEARALAFSKAVYASLDG
ncbi:serine hydrolase domain-containing protein [Corallococcus llansteffanensis]|uniref:Class A beta-lactamase-related serine hydrolase n=1 Tax=Corallococcus llansteffanensis TaxID=2316731 RepID=A0A3A8PGM7_9BACT|nr:serine hydrolase domain-containing protein [Corallococcus llansteffanensis]RKH53751.1 class A beta-lactamase-related serine hydrolase [Corallococcus llansteffanensis]